MICFVDFFLNNSTITCEIFQVCLLGVVTRDQPQCMLFEYMAQVSLAFDVPVTF